MAEVTKVYLWGKGVLKQVYPSGAGHLGNRLVTQILARATHLAKRRGIIPLYVISKYVGGSVVARVAPEPMATLYERIAGNVPAGSVVLIV